MLSRPASHLARSRLSQLSTHLSPISSNRPLLRMASTTTPSVTGGGPPSTGPPVKFPKSDVSQHNTPLGKGKYVTTAGCLIIGDEILSGKTHDKNSNYFAQFCFTRGIDLKRIEVIADDEEEIAEAVLRMSKAYDLLITSGGIGPTPDDITYESIGKAFGATPLEYHDETLRRMAELQKTRKYSVEQTEEMITARKRMALFPKESSSTSVEVLYTTQDLWVPVVRLAGKVCILPGVPRLFEALLDGLSDYIPLDTSRPRPFRYLIHTQLPESSISPFLVRLTDRCRKEDIKVGSYPKWNAGVDVSLIGTNRERLDEFAAEVEKETQGKLIASGKIGEE